MKIALINFSGNVGKSTISRHLMAPRIPGADIIAVETINSDGNDSEALKGKQFRDLIEALMVMDAAVVDIGASNVEDVMQLMRQYDGSHDVFDYFVVPVVPTMKQQRDTIATISELADIGVPASKIRTVFNQVEPDDDMARTFASIIKFHKAEKAFTLIENAVIHTNEIYGLLNGTTRSVTDVLNDETDYKEKIKEATDQKEKLKFARQHSIKLLAGGVSKEHDAVFKALFA